MPQSRLVHGQRLGTGEVGTGYIVVGGPSEHGMFKIICIIYIYIYNEYQLVCTLMTVSGYMMIYVYLQCFYVCAYITFYSFSPFPWRYTTLTSRCIANIHGFHGPSMANQPTLLSVEAGTSLILSLLQLASSRSWRCRGNKTGDECWLMMLMIWWAISCSRNQTSGFLGMSFGGWFSNVPIGVDT